MYVEHLAGVERENDIKEFLDKMQMKNLVGFWRTKRLIDLLVSVLAICVCLIPMLIIALIIFLSDVKAKPIYCQERVGRHGKVFSMYKFRTMVPDADQILDDLLKQNEADGPVFKMKRDPRVTRFGRFLRATSLDELPQLFNVIKGDMVIIGPRPPLPREVEHYTEYQKLRLTVTPGITCIWQVQPKRNDISFDDWLDMDLYYILNRSFGLDIKIAILTVFAMLRGEGR